MTGEAGSEDGREHSTRGKERTSQEAHTGMLGKQVVAFSTHARTTETKSVRWG